MEAPPPPPPEKAAHNLGKHGVTFFEAASVFSDPEALDLADEAHSGEEERSWRIGLSDEGGVLTVVYTVVVVNPVPGGEKVERSELQVRDALDLTAVASGRP